MVSCTVVSSTRFVERTTWQLWSFLAIFWVSQHFRWHGHPHHWQRFWKLQSPLGFDPFTSSPVSKHRDLIGKGPQDVDSRHARWKVFRDISSGSGVHFEWSDPKLVGGLEHFLFSIYWEFHPNWRSHIFQRGRSATNQQDMSVKSRSLLVWSEVICWSTPQESPTFPCRTAHPPWPRSKPSQHGTTSACALYTCQRQDERRWLIFSPLRKTSYNILLGELWILQL